MSTRAERRAENRAAWAARNLDRGRADLVADDGTATVTPDDQREQATADPLVDSKRAAVERRRAEAAAKRTAEATAAADDHQAVIAALIERGQRYVPSDALDGADEDTAAALSVLAALRVEDPTSPDGVHYWGARATAHQWADARAILYPGDHGPRNHFLTRPRGGSKTEDLAAVALAVLLCLAPTRARCLAYARDGDQAGLLLDALAGLVTRTPSLGDVLDVQTWRVLVRHGGASLTVESADAASAHGRKPFLVIVDELAQWPSTRGARALWEAIVSGTVKRPGQARLVVLTSAGDPAHWSHRVLTGARTSQRWRVSEMSGPVPWHDPEDLAEQRRMLLDSAYRRLHLNEWTGGEDRLVLAEDLAACVTLDGPQDHVPGWRYAIGLDLGLKNDRTVVSVVHAEPDPGDRSAPPRLVLDRMHVLQGTRAKPVNLTDVERLVRDVAGAYRAEVLADPWQAVGLAQRLRSGHPAVRVREFAFSSTSVGRLARVLHLALRDHRLALPDDPDLLDELGRVRLVENTPGVLRMDHDSGEHDDRAVALGLACLALTEHSGTGRGSAASPARYSMNDLAVQRAARQRTAVRIGGPAAAAARRADPSIRRLGGVTQRTQPL